MADDRRVFRVLFDFKANEKVELTVKKDDIVLAPASASVTDEWLLVENQIDSSQRGYVPSSYVSELLGAEAAQYLPRRSPAPTPRSAAVSSRTPLSGLNTTQPLNLTQPLNVTQRSSIAPSATPVSRYRSPGASATFTPGTSAATNETFTEMFARHEQYFKQVMKQREETFKKLEGSIASAAKEIAVCQEKNTKLNQRITDLDNLIEDERRKWKERLELEKKSLLMRSFATTAL